MYYNILFIHIYYFTTVNFKFFLQLGIDKSLFDVIMLSSAWSDGRKLGVMLNLRKVRAS